MTGQDCELISRIKNHDHTAFYELYQKYSGYAFGTALLLVRDYSVAADVCQDAFIRVFENIHKFKEDKPFKPWFYRIMVNEAMRLTRRIKRWPKIMERVPDIPSPVCHEPESVVMAKEQAAYIRTVVNQLPAKLKVPVVLRYYADLTEEEIAHALNIPVGTVKSRLFRGREQLSHLLKENIIPLGGIYHA